MRTFITPPTACRKQRLQQRLHIRYTGIAHSAVMHPSLTGISQKGKIEYEIISLEVTKEMPSLSGWDIRDVEYCHHPGRRTPCQTPHSRPLGDSSPKLRVCAFHPLCLSYVRMFAATIGTRAQHKIWSGLKWLVYRSHTNHEVTHQAEMGPETMGEGLQRRMYINQTGYQSLSTTCYRAVY